MIMHKAGNFNQATKHFEDALHVFDGDRVTDCNELRVYSDAAYAYGDLNLEYGFYQEAKRYYVRALEGYKLLQDQTGAYNAPIRKITAILENL